MSTAPKPSLGRRVYRALFRVFGPADVGPTGPPAAINPNDQTVPTGYHLETITDGSGTRRRIAVPDPIDHGHAPGSPRQHPDQT